MRCPCWFLVKFQCDWNPCYPAFSPAKPLSLSEVWEASQGMSSQAGENLLPFSHLPLPSCQKGLWGSPDWELAVTVLVSTVPFLGMGSVLEEFRVGLALADRLPLSKRFTSSSSVPVESSPGFFP